MNSHETTLSLQDSYTMPACINRIIRIFIVLLVFFVFHSCSPSSRLQGFMYLRLNADPSTLDPALIVDITGGYIAAKIFNGLVRLDENLNVIPDIAESWEVSDKGTTYIFHLKKNVIYT